MKYKLKTKIVYNNMLLNANLYTETIKMFVTKCLTKQNLKP